MYQVIKMIIMINTFLFDKEVGLIFLERFFSNVLTHAIKRT